MQFYKRTKGHLGQYEDWWNLNEKDGIKTVTHLWSHTKVNGLNTNSGHKEYSVDEFLTGDHHTGAKSALSQQLEG